MLNKIKLYIGYWLIMLSFYPYRKVFVWDWLTLKESFEEASYIAPCEDVVVELPFMVKRVMRGRRPSNELCKQCMRYEYCNEYHFMIGENYKPACVNVREDSTCIIDEDNL